MTDREVLLLKAADACSAFGVALRELIRHEAAEKQAGTQLLSKAQVAAKLAVSTKTVDRLISAKQLPTVMVGHHPRVPLSSLEKFETKKRSA